MVRTLTNAGWLLGGKGVGGALSLVYLGLAARSLGLAGFGTFALIIAYAQAIANLVQFQSWQLIIHYGAKHLQAQRLDRVNRLLNYTALVDVGSAVVSAIVAVSIAGLAAMLFHWSMGDRDMAALFGLSLIFALRATPTGVLRLFDRFDLATYAETVTPIFRFVGAALAYFLMPTLEAFLIVWALGELVTSAAFWGFTLRELRRQSVPFRPEYPRGVTAENPGLWRFAWMTNMSTSVNLIWQQLATLALGVVSGAAAAGAFRLAFQIAQAMAKPALLLARAIYPEFTRLADPTALSRSLRVTTGIAAIAGVAIVAATFFLGKGALTLLAGAEFASAAPVLTILSVAVAIDLCGFAFEPALLAMGRAGYALAARAIAGVIYAGLLALFLIEYGAVGAAFANIAGSLCALLLAVYFVRRAARSAAASAS